MAKISGTVPLQNRKKTRDDQSLVSPHSREMYKNESNRERDGFVEKVYKKCYNPSEEKRESVYWFLDWFYLEAERKL